MISGQVQKQSDQAGIGYVNIGIQNAGIGTISNKDGSFSLAVPEKNIHDTLQFSAIGFVRKSVPIQAFIKQHVTVELKEQVTQLSEVTVSARKEKNRTFEFGNRDFQGGVIQTDTAYAGASMALLINPHQRDFSFPVFVQAARIRIVRNNLKSLRIRVRLYDVDSVSGGPGAELTKESVVLESTMKNGWLEFDMAQSRMIVSRPFFIAFEQLLNKDDRASIANGYREFKQKHPNKIRIDTVVRNGEKSIRQIFLGGLDLPGTYIAIATDEEARQQFTCYNRQTSFDQWKKVRGIVAASVTVSNQFVSH